jgi:hypothetical protein
MWRSLEDNSDSFKYTNIKQFFGELVRVNPGLSNMVEAIYGTHEYVFHPLWESAICLPSIMGHIPIYGFI